MGSLATVYTCYNNNPNPCTSSSNSTSVSLPITQRTVVTAVGGLQSQTTAYYNSYGLPTEVDQSAFGSGSPGGTVRKTLTSYAGFSNPNINDRPSDIQIQNSGGTAYAHSTYSYDSNSNLQTETRYTGGTPSPISRTFAYNSYGVETSATDFTNNSNTATAYSSFICNNAFPQNISVGGLTTAETWDCNGGVMTSLEDPNSQTTHFYFDTTHNFWRLASTSFPGGGSTGITYTSPTVLDINTGVAAPPPVTTNSIWTTSAV